MGGQAADKSEPVQDGGSKEKAVSAPADGMFDFSGGFGASPSSSVSATVNDN